MKAETPTPPRFTDNTCEFDTIDVRLVEVGVVLRRTRTSSLLGPGCYIRMFAVDYPVIRVVPPDVGTFDVFTRER